MKNYIFGLVILVSMFVFSQGSRWEKQGVASGVINDIGVISHSESEKTIHIGTENGLFSKDSLYVNQWIDESAGLEESSVKKIFGTQICVNLNLLLFPGKQVLMTIPIVPKIIPQIIHLI